MPTPDRTTIRAAVDELVNKLRSNLTADPPTATRPFRSLVLGDVGHESAARPFLGLRLVQARTMGATGDDRIFEVSLVSMIVTDVTAGDPHGAMLDKIGAYEDYLDSLRDTGVIVGAEGLDEREWEFSFPKESAGPRVLMAEAEQSIVVKVQRQFNRVPAA